jgi:hypothetical protein
MDLVDKIIELTDLFDDNVLTTADKISPPEPKQEVLDREAINEFMKRNPMAYGGRIPFADAGTVDPKNKVKKGQDLGEGIAQRLKYTNEKGENTIRYVTSGIKDDPIKEHKTFKEAKDYRKMLIKKYGEPGTALEEYKGKFNYKELSKDPDFVDFWKSKVDGKKLATRSGLFKGERSVEDSIKKVIKKYKLKPDDYENIFNKVVEETRISEAVRKGTKFGKGKKMLISNAIVGNLIETFNKSYKPNVGTVNVTDMEKLLKLPKGELIRLMSNIDKPYPKEALRFAKSDTVSRINKAATLKKILDKEGITYAKLGRGGGEGTGSAEYRFKLDPDKNKADKKFTKLLNSKTFKLTEKQSTKPTSTKQVITTLSKQSDEYKKFGYGRDRNAINNLTNALNNSMKAMSDKELYNFVNKNPKIKNLVTATFDARAGKIINIPLKNFTMDQIRTRAKFEVDHIRGRATVNFDPATKKILDGINIEYPKNLYIIPKAINNGVKKQVENFVENFPNQTKTIKNLDNYFKANKLTYFNRNTGQYGGYKPSNSALDMSQLGITKKKELEKLITGTYTDRGGVKRVITKDPQKTIATVNELSKVRGGPTLGMNLGFLKGFGEAIKATPTLAGGVALNTILGVDPTSAIDRASIAAETAFAPQLVKQAAKFGPVAERFFNLGLSPAMAARAARIASPIGLASLAAEGAYQAGKFTKKRIAELKAMSPEERAELRQKGEAFAFDPFQAAGGGIAKLAGDPSGAMLESMNPDSQGLRSLKKRVKTT